MKSTNKRLTIEITKKLHDTIKRVAKEEDKTIKQWLIEAAAEKMNRISEEENEKENDL